MAVVRLSAELYRRLEKHAEGFDTPANVIEKILNEYEGVTDSTPEYVPPDSKPLLVFIPDEETFRTRLLERKVATRTLYHRDGTVEEKLWKANSFSPSSNLRGNIWSGPLRGWEVQGIIKAEFRVEDD